MTITYKNEQVKKCLNQAGQALEMKVYVTANGLIDADGVPVFISCKNGIVTADELYKLSTVAERFGGQYSKKVLVVTALESLGEAGNYLRQRTKDMNIRLIEDIRDLDDALISGSAKRSCRYSFRF